MFDWRWKRLLIRKGWTKISPNVYELRLSQAVTVQVRKGLTGMMVFDYTADTKQQGKRRGYWIFTEAQLVADYDKWLKDATEICSLTLKDVIEHSKLMKR